jgi:hypothetical protein
MTSCRRAEIENGTHAGLARDDEALISQDQRAAPAFYAARSIALAAASGSR